MRKKKKKMNWVNMKKKKIDEFLILKNEIFYFITFNFNFKKLKIE